MKLIGAQALKAMEQGFVISVLHNHCPLAHSSEVANQIYDFYSKQNISNGEVHRTLGSVVSHTRHRDLDIMTACEKLVILFTVNIL